jgi:uncharacterized membrane protein YdjX (TVP38/TMEM64 family)
MADNHGVEAPGTGAVKSAGGSWAWLKLLLGAAALAALLFLGREAGAAIPRFAAWVEGLGIWGPLAFIGGYALATVAFVPGWPLTLVGGAVFGVVWGTAYVLVGATLGASLAFLVARYLARRAIERKLEERPRFRAIDRAVGREGFKIVALLRLSPVFPFNLLNYALGLTRVRFLHYLAACLFMLPGTLLYVYSGSLAGDAAAALAAGGGGGRTPAQWALLAVGLAATAVVTVLITRKARQAIAQEVEAGDG